MGSLHEGGTVGAMLITSALLHRVNWTPSQRQAWRRADHSTIYLAITGTYFALAGLTMHGRIRTVVLIIIAISTVVGGLIVSVMTALLSVTQLVG